MLFGKIPQIIAKNMNVYEGDYDKFDMTISKTVKAKVTSTTSVSVNCPVAIRVNNLGEVTCFDRGDARNYGGEAVDRNRGGRYWGVVESVEKDGATGDIATVVIAGKATLLTATAGLEVGDFVTGILGNGLLEYHNQLESSADNHLGIYLGEENSKPTIYIY